MFVLYLPAAAHVSVQRAADVYTMSPGRIGAIAAALLGLISIVIGGLVIRSIRRNATGNGRSRAIIALTTALIGMVIGGVVVATSDNGIGTGTGRGGAYFALILGLLGIVLAGLVLARARRSGLTGSSARGKGHR